MALGALESALAGRSSAEPDECQYVIGCRYMARSSTPRTSKPSLPARSRACTPTRSASQSLTSIFTQFTFFRSRAHDLHATAGHPSPFFTPPSSIPLARCSAHRAHPIHVHSARHSLGGCVAPLPHGHPVQTPHPRRRRQMALLPSFSLDRRGSSLSRGRPSLVPVSASLLFTPAATTRRTFGIRERHIAARLIRSRARALRPVSHCSLRLLSSHSS